MALECTLLKKTIWKNSSSIICVNCNQQCQLRCYYPKAKKKVEDWLCSLCLPSVFPFSGIRDLSTFDDDELRKLDENRNFLSLVQLNTQSMVLSFDEFAIFANKHSFDIIAVTETWSEPAGVCKDWRLQHALQQQRRKTRWRCRTLYQRLWNDN